MWKHFHLQSSFSWSVCVGSLFSLTMKGRKRLGNEVFDTATTHTGLVCDIIGSLVHDTTGSGLFVTPLGHLFMTPLGQACL